MKKRIVLIICAVLLLLSLAGCGNRLPEGYGYITVDYSSVSIEGTFKYVNETTVKVTTDDGKVMYIPTSSIEYITVKGKK